MICGYRFEGSDSIVTESPTALVQHLLSLSSLLKAFLIGVFLEIIVSQVCYFSVGARQILTVSSTVLDVQVGQSPAVLEEPMTASLAIVESVQCRRASFPFSHSM
jgi:hypothetical protein